MVGDISANEVELLNAYQILGPTGQKELKDYLRYLLCKQYKREVMVAVFHNKLLHNLLLGLLHMVEKDDFDIEQASRRVRQIKELYYGIFEQVHIRFSEVVLELDSNEVVREFGRINFANIEREVQSGHHSRIKFEILEFYQGYNKLAKRKDARQIVAV